jgi:hypothetical protein
MKPLIFPDGTIMRAMDDFNFLGSSDKVRIRFLKEDIDGKPIFVSELPADVVASFAEQTPIIRKDGILFTFYPAIKGQKFAETFDRGETWKPGGYYPMQFSINTKCILKTLPSGRVLLVPNDVQMKEENGKKTLFYTNKNGKECEFEKQKTPRTRMTAYLSDATGRPLHIECFYATKVKSVILQLPSDGSIYIVYVQGHGVIGQQTIFLSKITEEDILAGKLINDESFLNIIISRPSDHGGGRREGDKI